MMNEAETVVESINNDMYDKLSEYLSDEDSVLEVTGMCMLVYVSTGNEQLIQVGEFTLWSSEDDERGWIEPYHVDARREPLELFVKGKLCDMIDDFVLIKRVMEL